MKFNPNRKGIMSLEGLEAEVPETEVPEVEETTEAVADHDPEALVENELIELEVAEDDIEEIEEAIDEGEAVAVTVDGIAEQLELTAAEGGEGVSEPVAEALAAATEHFQSRLGYTGKPVMPAMESFSANRLDATKLAIEQHKQLSAGIHKSLEVAQEGLLDRIKNKWAMIFSTEEKLTARLAEVSKTYDAGTVKTEPLVNPAWGKALNHEGKAEITPADIMADLAKFQTQFSGDGVATTLEMVAHGINGVTTAIGKSSFIANDAAVAEINKGHLAIMNLIAAAEKEFEVTAKGKTNATFTPVDAATKKKMVTALQDVLANKKLDAALDKLDTALMGWYHADANALRLAGDAADDLAAASAAVKSADDLYSKATALASRQLNLCHGVISYIADSAGKAQAAPAEKEVEKAAE